MLLLAHPAPDVVLKRGPEVGLEKDHIILPVQCPAVQSQTPILLDLGLDHTLQQRKGLSQNMFGSDALNLFTDV